jgi:hypothetical protein
LTSVFWAPVILRQAALWFVILAVVYYWFFHWPIVIVGEQKDISAKKD